MLQEPWFTWIFCVIPFAVLSICKYWLMGFYPDFTDGLKRSENC